MPTYAGLIGNVLLEFLSFSEHPFPVTPSSQFPTFAGTNAYLKAFALPFIESGHIRLRREEIEVEEIDGGGCVVHMKDSNKGDGTVLEETWDAVVITTMWFDAPYSPHVPLNFVSNNCSTSDRVTWMGSHEGYEGNVLLSSSNFTITQTTSNT